MLKARRFIATVLLSSIFTGYAGAQTAQVQLDAKTSAPAVTASASDKGARYAAPGEVLQIRLEIYAPTGEVVFDSGQRAGGVLDWKVADVQQGMADGSYLAVVTVKDLRGKLSQRLGAVTLQGGSVTLGRATETELSLAQTQALNSARQSRKILAPANEDSTLTILRDGMKRSVTVTAHDGQDGQVTSTSGALTLRTGDVLTGKDKEHVRITPEGQVGIGTDKPEAALDVAGTIRARGGIVFDDGTMLKSATGLGSGSGGGNTILTVSQPGTASPQAGQQVDGDITFTPGSGLYARDIHLSDNNGGLRFYGAPSLTSSPEGAAIQFFGNGNALFPGQAFIDAGANNNSAIIFRTAITGGTITERMRVTALGNVGVGTNAPTAKLEVAGNLKISGAGNKLIFADGTSLTTAPAAGGSMTGSAIVSAINDPATMGLINDNRVSSNVARLNGVNAWAGANVFSAGLSANNALITNVGTPVAATDAASKGYVDSSFVRFVPGAEQLSVGDANGTATMINLRGGSTCCSGPGGHTPAFFKVFQNGSFVATGNLGIGVSPKEGQGYRTSWHTYKGAFRSGYADNEWDDANTGFFSWAGGSNSTASGLYAFAFGDTNFARSTSSIAFGSGNEVKGAAGFSAGAGNRVCDTYGVAFGNNARSGGPYIDGKCDPETFNLRGLAAVAIGYNVTADQDHTTAMGKFASNNGFSGTFVWGDGSAIATADTFRNTANNEFAARASGGFRFRTNLTGTTGCNLPAGSGVFNCTSSRMTKENFLAVDGDDVLGRLRKVPVSTWNYINEGSQVRHMGPMAEDFHTAFGLGADNTSIGVQDLAGVNLVAVKALEARTAKLQESNAQLGATLQQKNAEVEQLRNEMNSLRATTNALAQRLDALEQGKQQSNPAPGATKQRGN